MKTAIISVSDKTNIVKLVKFLLENKYKILSTGGTYSKLIEEFQYISHHIQEVSSYTNYPEFLDGRVKTLHPKIHGGILAKRDNSNHMNQLIKININEIDII